MLPLTLDVENLAIVLVGRGDAVLRHLAALDAADARSLRVFSDDPPPGLAATAGDRLRRLLPTSDDVAAARLVLIAGLPRDLSERLAAAARAHGALVNVEDVAALSDVHMPAVVRRGALSVAISTGGRSPGLARLLKGVVERLLDPRWGQWLDELAAQRARWRAAGLAMAEVSRRTAAWVRARGWLGGDRAVSGSVRRRDGLWIDLHGRRHAGHQANAIRHLIDVDVHRHALGEPHPGEDRVDRGEALQVGLRVRDIDGARDAADMAANDLAVAHQLDAGGVALVDPLEHGLLEIAVDPERVGIDD